MLNQYVNMSPQQKMAQMLQQQQSQQTPLQGDQPQQMPQAENPFGGATDAMKMYGQMSQRNNMQDMQDYLARMKLGQAQTGGIFDSANAQAPSYTGDMGT